MSLNKEAHVTGQTSARIYIAGCGGMLGRAFYEEFSGLCAAEVHGYRCQRGLAGVPRLP